MKAVETQIKPQARKYVWKDMQKAYQLFSAARGKALHVKNFVDADYYEATLDAIEVEMKREFPDKFKQSSPYLVSFI